MGNDGGEGLVLVYLAGGDWSKVRKRRPCKWERVGRIKWKPKPEDEEEGS